MKLPPAKERSSCILAILKKTWPDARCALNFKTPLELLVATILSAQCTDVRVNLVTPALFKRYRSAAAFAAAPVADIEKMIRSTGFYRNKARSIKNCCGTLAAEHGGEIPKDMDALTGLSGVGRKTANVIRAYAFGLPGIICDTHVLRLSERLGLTRNKNAGKVEKDLAALLPQKDWTSFSTLIVAHGRQICHARKPECGICPIFELCPAGDKFAQ